MGIILRLSRKNLETFRHSSSSITLMTLSDTFSFSQSDLHLSSFLQRADHDRVAVWRKILHQKLKLLSKTSNRTNYLGEKADLPILVN